MSPKRRYNDSPSDAPADERRPAQRSEAATDDRLTSQETAAWGDLLGFILEQARADPNNQASDPQPRRAPALTAARRATLAFGVVIARHRWPAACDALLTAREVFEANVAADGRSVRVRCTAQTAAMLDKFAMETQP